MTTDNNALAKAEVSPINTVRSALEKMKPQFAAALPQHITPDRLLRVAMTAIQTTPKLLDCDRQSLYAAIMKAAQLGLEPDGILGQAYLIPYGKTVQFIPGYKGLIDLARRSGEVSNIIAKEVCKNDKFDVQYHLEMPFSHTPKLDGDRGEVTHFWALARFKDGGFHWDYMTRAEVEAIRDQSSGWQSAKKWNKTAESPWEKHFIEMGKKTVIRRIAKFLPMSVQRAATMDQLNEAGKNAIINDYGEIVIDGTINQGGDDAQDVTQSTASKLDNFAGKDSAKHNPETGEVIEGVVNAAKETNATDQAEPPTKEITPLSEKPTGAEATAYGKIVLEELKAQPDNLKLQFFNMRDGERLIQVLKDKGMGILAAEIRKVVPELQGGAA